MLLRGSEGSWADPALCADIGRAGAIAAAVLASIAHPLSTVGVSLRHARLIGIEAGLLLFRVAFKYAEEPVEREIGLDACHFRLALRGGAPRRDLALEFMPLPAQIENLPLKRRPLERFLLGRFARLRLLLRRFGTGPHGRSVKTIRRSD